MGLSGDPVLLLLHCAMPCSAVLKRMGDRLEYHVSMRCCSVCQLHDINQVLRRAGRCCAVLCGAVRCCAVRCCSVLCCSVLCCSVL